MKPIFILALMLRVFFQSAGKPDSGVLVSSVVMGSPISPITFLVVRKDDGTFKTVDDGSVIGTRWEEVKS